MQRLIAVKALSGVEQELGRAPQQKSQTLGGSLKTVVQNTQDLFVVRVPRSGVCELVKIHELVPADDGAGKSSQPHEPRQQFQLIVDVRIIDDRSHTEGGACISPRRELTTQPSHGVRFQRLVAGVMAFPIRRDHLGKVVTIHHLGQR